MQEKKLANDTVCYLDMSTNELIHVTDDFLKQNSKFAKTKRSNKKGGPHSRVERDKRRDEVYRLFFEYGYSARKIADLMKVNRNTINGDIDYWYSKIANKVSNVNPEPNIILILESMGAQITRLRELLDKCKNISERMSIERLMFDINSKIIYTNQKLADSTAKTQKLATKWYNETMKKKNMPDRGISLFDTISVSNKAYDKIHRIINEDRNSV